MNFVNLNRWSHGWVNFSCEIARRGYWTICESEPECLGIYQFYPFFLPAPIPLMCSLSSLNTPLCIPVHTHIQICPHGYQGDDNVTLNCCHLCWASTNENSMKKNVIKNTWTAVCTAWVWWTGRSKKKGEEKKKDLDNLMMAAYHGFTKLQLQDMIQTIWILGYTGHRLLSSRESLIMNW